MKLPTLPGPVAVEVGVEVVEELQVKTIITSCSQRLLENSSVKIKTLAIILIPKKILLQQFPRFPGIFSNNSGVSAAAKIFQEFKFQFIVTDPA